MDLHRAVIEAADKLQRSVWILKQMREVQLTDETVDDHLMLMLQQAKRVRRDATMTTRAIAAAIDATTQEGTSE